MIIKPNQNYTLSGVPIISDWSKVKVIDIDEERKIFKEVAAFNKKYKKFKEFIDKYNEFMSGKDIEVIKTRAVTSINHVKMPQMPATSTSIKSAIWNRRVD